MVKRHLLLSLCWLFLVVPVAPETQTAAQETEPHIQVVVNLVQLNVAVTDGKGNYVTGLRPQDFAITEDGIHEKIATFAEGNEPTRQRNSKRGSTTRATTTRRRPALQVMGGATADLSLLPSREKVPRRGG